MRSAWLANGAIALSLSGVAVNAVFPGFGFASGARPALRTEAAFLNWLFESDNQDRNETPRTKRGDDFCLVNFEPNVVNQVWRDRPAFIVQGSPRSLAVYRDTAQDPIWEYPVNDAEVVVYTGPPLEPDTMYTLRARHPQFPSSIYEQRQLRTMSFDAEAQTTGNLLTLEGETRNAGETSETAIAIAKADYLWEQGLETDAWATLWPLQSADPAVAGAIATGVDAFCNPAPTSDSTLE